MNDTLKIFIAAILFFIIDGSFLTLMRNHWATQIQAIQKSPMKTNIVSAILAYCVMIFAWVYFIYKPGKKYKIKLEENVLRAFLLGFSIYAVFDFTNFAILKNWTVTTALLDILWGSTLYALITFIVGKIN